jgi:hypothetical protein
MLNSKVLTDDIFRREIKSLDRYEIALAQAPKKKSLLNYLIYCRVGVIILVQDQ